VYLTTNAGRPADVRLPHQHFGGFVVFASWLHVVLLLAQFPGWGRHLLVFGKVAWASLEVCLAILPLFIGAWAGQFKGIGSRDEYVFFKAHNNALIVFTIFCFLVDEKI
jgi:hypothetical protein